jgi:hypothetical protein
MRLVIPGFGGDAAASWLHRGHIVSASLPLRNRIALFHLRPICDLTFCKSLVA